MNNIEKYICLNCRDIGKEDLVRILKQKMAHNLNEEDRFQLGIVNLRLICDKLKSENESEMGFREKLLNDKLEDLKVARQAYHGNVFVGNHCKIVLTNYQLLCSVISDKLDKHVKIIIIIILTQTYSFKHNQLCVPLTIK